MKLIMMGTMTAAQRGRAVLARAGIASRVRRVTGAGGCAYALEVAERDYRRAVFLISNA